VNLVLNIEKVDRKMASLRSDLSLTADNANWISRLTFLMTESHLGK
jgi:hypothetical protein